MYRNDAPVSPTLQSQRSLFPSRERCLKLVVSGWNNTLVVCWVVSTIPTSRIMFSIKLLSRFRCSSCGVLVKKLVGMITRLLLDKSSFLRASNFCWKMVGILENLLLARTKVVRLPRRLPSDNSSAWYRRLSASER